MNLMRLVVTNLTRNTLRTLLTLASVAVALFLFTALGGILDTLRAAIEVGSRQRLVTRNATSLIFPMPQSYGPRIAQVAGVLRVAKQNWFGGQDPKDPRNFYAQFGVDDTFWQIYRNDMRIVEAVPPRGGGAVPEGADRKLAGYFEQQTGAIVGDKLMKKLGWKLGQTVTVAGTIFPGTWEFTIAGVYRAVDPAFGEETMFFPWRYLEQKGMGGSGQVGVYVLELTDSDRASDIARQVDALFANSPAETRTESEQAFQAGFISMFGNIPFALSVIGLAVVFAILLVAANTMVMAIRERTSEIGVLKTLGFQDRTLFGMVLAEGALITLIGGVLGALFAKFAIETSNFNAGGFLPPVQVEWATVVRGILVAVALGAISGFIPAWQASRLRIVDALRRVD